MIGRALLLGAVLALPGRGLAQEPGPPEAERLSVEGYARALEEIAPLLENDRVEEARDRARGLLRAEVEFAGEPLRTDSTILDGVVSAKDRGEARLRAARVRRLAAALRAIEGPPTPAREPRPEVLARLQPGDVAPRGGEVGSLQVEAPSLPERAGNAVLAAFDWLASVMKRILDWLRRFGPRTKTSPSGQGGATTAAIAVVAVAAAILAVLAYRTLRRASGPGVDVESDRLLASSQDEDPLSREAGEWEKHARDLAAAGRWREAVRAWYHAVLVCLFQRGLLHYQKGRTNWEYAARLAPETAWRPTFLELTRLFDREWYGRSASDPEAVREFAQGAREILRAARGAGDAA